MSAKLPLIIFVGPSGSSTPEQWVAGACRANAVDLVTRAAAIPSLGPILLVTPQADWVAQMAGLPVEVVSDPSAGAFHFGQRLREIASAWGFSRLLYMGGGAGALLTLEDLDQLARRALALEQGVVTNNLYSTDFAALAPASALETIDLPASDNDLAWRLAAAGLPVQRLPASAATRLDLDTPNDLAVAALHPACGPALRQWVARLPLKREPLRQVLAALRSPQGEVLVYGRVSATAWAQLEALPCQTRVFSEERGMQASGRLARGEVRAWLGALFERVGPRDFFQTLAGVCTAGLLDTRVLFAHLGLHPPAADRFHSDLLEPAAVRDPAVRALTEAAQAAPVPLLLGGQGLVSGDLMALAEIATGRASRLPEGY